MKIKLENTITIDNQIDVITEEYEAEWVKKGDIHYFSYSNNEKEKVVIKYKENELVMSRFSSPTSVMRFRLKNYDNAKIATPMGLQNLVTKTNHLEMDVQHKKIFLHYDLLIEPETDNILASYQLLLNWFD
ncbi:DUF1934 domain-containing protein [Streptococcus zalophi]|uniref:DUF1934 domain-containing protein n=1 Tax=Streptococcus zalophi TaxID=640031 RepID=A0A934UCZ7_9STRE|nr:DUF1934 domain-containing protein [Streptococcus zalophi]MBJ8349158.1 DUF1934 domain-containing protein [Streptococcus zalophi]MCR8967219.1 DUF1934 domain-containing protein [Streptococcus zalophi]